MRWHPTCPHSILLGRHCSNIGHYMLDRSRNSKVSVLSCHSQTHNVRDLHQDTTIGRTLVGRSRRSNNSENTNRCMQRNSLDLQAYKLFGPEALGMFPSCTPFVLWLHNQEHSCLLWLNSGTASPQPAQRFQVGSLRTHRTRISLLGKRWTGTRCH